MIHNTTTWIHHFSDISNFFLPAVFSAWRSLATNLITLTRRKLFILTSEMLSLFCIGHCNKFQWYHVLYESIYTNDINFVDVMWLYHICTNVGTDHSMSEMYILQCTVRKYVYLTMFNIHVCFSIRNMNNVNNEC